MGERYALNFALSIFINTGWGRDGQLLSTSRFDSAGLSISETKHIVTLKIFPSLAPGQVLSLRLGGAP
jgi:hypothetical protein